jgi:hypothetical protein
MNNLSTQSPAQPETTFQVTEPKVTGKRVRKTPTIRIKKLSTDVDMDELTAKNKKIKLQKQEKEIPTINNIDKTKDCNYSVFELKHFLKSHNLLQTGTKQILHERLFSWLNKSRKAVKIQSVYRGYVVCSVHRLFRRYQKMRSDCVNDQDFCSFEPLTDVDKYQIICVKDPDGPVYGFDIYSICQYKRKLELGVELTNPYTRNKFAPSFFAELSKIVYASKHNIIPTNIDNDPNEDVESLPFEKRVELRALSVFQHINSLGNYSDASWFMDLSRTRTIRMIQELYDIWGFRLNIRQEIKRNIFPPTGNPFGNTMSVNIGGMSDTELKNLVLEIIENFVFKGVNRDAQCLGSFYVLGSLTLVNKTAADSLPWLFQSFIY